MKGQIQPPHVKLLNFILFIHPLLVFPPERDLWAMSWGPRGPCKEACHILIIPTLSNSAFAIYMRGSTQDYIWRTWILLLEHMEKQHSMFTQADVLW